MLEPQPCLLAGGIHSDLHLLVRLFASAPKHEASHVHNKDPSENPVSTFTIHLFCRLDDRNSTSCGTMMFN